MSTDSLVKNLHPLEIKVLLNFNADENIFPETLGEKLEFNVGQCNQSCSWLSAKSLIQEKSRTLKVVYELTELGETWAGHGSPDARILALLKERGPLTMPEINEALGLENRDTGSAFGQMRKEGVLKMNAEKQVSLADESKAMRIQQTGSLLAKAQQMKSLAEEDLSADEKGLISGLAKKRGASSVPFKIVERDEVIYVLTQAGVKTKKELQEAGVTGEEIGSLTSKMLSDGSWKGKSFRSYNVQVPPSRVMIGRTNPYCDYLASVKDQLTSLGFEEFDGPLVETEFWNSDSLFMPQFHSARDIHDVYYVKEPVRAKEIEQPYLDNIAAAHENGWTTGSRGWDYAFDKDFTKHLILRSQGTVLSAKQLPTAKIPGKYFGVARCFRYDQVDATHLSDFYQTEGIVVGENVNLRNLLGLLKMFAEEVAGATEVKYVPGYFPFTEPSVEVHIKHPVLGWFELGGSGIFRPEVTKPLGIDVPVLAWGLGIDRMALMHLGLNDLRELFSHNIEDVRLRKRS